MYNNIGGSSLKEAFKMQPKTNIINQDVGLQMEHSYIEQDTLDNINQSFHQMKNYRTPQYTNNNGVNTRHYNRRSEKYFKNKYARIN
jgi:hypothetical protein